MAELAVYTVWVPTLMLVIFRVAGIFIMAPLLSDSNIPIPVKILLSVILGLAVTARLTLPVAMPDTWLSLVMGIGGEMLIGATIGYTTSLIFVGVQIGAEQMAQQMGIALASVFNPMIEDATNALGGLFDITVLAIFLVIGGHRAMIGALMDSFGQVPLMGFSVQVGLLEAVLSLLTASFVLAMKLAAPTLVALFLATIAMGIIQKTMPQLNILSVGFQVRVLLALVILAVGVASLLPLLQRGWEITMQELVKVF